MTSHPNRGQRTGSSNPTPDEVREWRRARGLTAEQAGGLVDTTGRVWYQWEDGTRRMHPAFWELARIKAALDGR